MALTLTQLIAKFDEKGIPHDWELMISLPNEWLDLLGISIIDQGEVELVFEDQQRIVSLAQDPEEYNVSIPS